MSLALRYECGEIRQVYGVPDAHRAPLSSETVSPHELLTEEQSVALDLAMQELEDPGAWAADPPAWWASMFLPEWSLNPLDHRAGLSGAVLVHYGQHVAFWNGQKWTLRELPHFPSTQDDNSHAFTYATLWR